METNIHKFFGQVYDPRIDRKGKILFGGAVEVVPQPEIKELSISGTLVIHNKPFNSAIDIFGNCVSNPFWKVSFNYFLVSLYH